MKYIIITADDLGLDIATNRAIFEGFNAGTLTACSIIPNSESLDDAVKNVVKPNPTLDIGIQLNITEGKSLITNYESYLTSNDGFYNNCWKKLLLFSNNNKYLEQIEAEFAAQIEHIISLGIKPAYLCSHHNTHIIPQIFNIVCKLANKYNIKNIRTLTEIPYIVPELYRHVEGNYISRVIKNIVFNTSTQIIQSALNNYDLNTSEYYLGTLYNGQMDKDSVFYGLQKIPNDTLTEIVFHPTTNRWKHMSYLEYKTIINQEFIEKIHSEEYELLTWTEITNSSKNAEEPEEKSAEEGRERAFNQQEDETANLSYHTLVSPEETNVEEIHEEVTAAAEKEENPEQKYENKHRYETIVHAIKLSEKPDDEEEA